MLELCAGVISGICPFADMDRNTAEYLPEQFLNNSFSVLEASAMLRLVWGYWSYGLLRD